MSRSARTLESEKLPLVDLGASGLAAAARSIGRACEEAGFFVVAGHGVPKGLVERVFAESARFHALPVEEKLKLTVNRFHRGYVPLASYRLDEKLSPNLSESLVLMHELGDDDPDLLAERPLSGPNQWPQLPGFRETMLEYTAAISGLALRLLSAFALALDLPEAHFRPMFAKPTTFLRLLHYPPQPPDSPENQFGSAPHTDYGAITILAQDAAGGLHVRHRSGGWIEATPIPGTFVVNVGDVMARFTNDRFVSTRHRVLNLSGGDRYSVPFFFDPNMEATVACLPTCHSAAGPERYPPVRYGDYLLARLDAHYAYRKAGAAAV